MALEGCGRRKRWNSRLPGLAALSATKYVSNPGQAVELVASTSTRETGFNLAHWYLHSSLPYNADSLCLYYLSYKVNRASACLSERCQVRSKRLPSSHSNVIYTTIPTQSVSLRISNALADRKWVKQPQISMPRLGKFSGVPSKAQQASPSWKVRAYLLLSVPQSAAERSWDSKGKVAIHTADCEF